MVLSLPLLSAKGTGQAEPPNIIGRQALRRIRAPCLPLLGPFLIQVVVGFSWNAQIMRGAAKKAAIEGASEELERRSQYLSSLIQRTRMMIDAGEYKKEVVEVAIKPERRALQQHERCPESQLMKLEEEGEEEEEKKSVQDPPPGQLLQHQPPPNVKIRAADMPLALQKRAFRCASEMIASMPKRENKRLALALKKEFDWTYGPAWHCIVGTSFGSYVTHSLGGFLYFSIDKVHVLLFRTAVEPIDR